jgi:hypothetical protein
MPAKYKLHSLIFLLQYSSTFNYIKKYMQKSKIVRIATASISIHLLLKGQLTFLRGKYEVIAVAGDENYLEEIRIRERVGAMHIPMMRKISILRDLNSLL